MYANRNAGDPTKWTYEADTTRQSRTAGSWSVASLRLTAQATPRNKFNIYRDEQKPCTGATYSADDDGCRSQPSEGGFVYGGSATAAPETATDDEQYFTNDEKVAYRLNNGIPNLVTLTLRSNLRKLRTRYHALYAQEQWTLGRMTLQGALRFDHAWSYSPEQVVGPTRFLANPIVFPETPGVVGYNDISQRMGVAYDLFGNGKTAIKVNLGRYLDAASNNNGNYSITNPTSRMAGSTELGRPPIRGDGPMATTTSFPAATS
jgi:hypothetical protein